MTFPNGTVALQGVDLTVDRGQFVSVVGPSGCGKSTLLRIASGLETASDGTAGGRRRPDRLRLPGRHPAALAERAGGTSNCSPSSATSRRPSGSRRRSTRSTWSG
ncbi:ATP-binding cassette domain-containing protein [Curtobacterium sp. MCPF17_052]|uniref:ATP-binding cassette domain-containing protein n=1 Tax=Curtobacterium sp. MCPF17_052 TaxID=2175655 RepID=UPI0024E02FF0|nr:ATP-binding cassette domain-containing protein [Curtobacterium sp. MCPF17_052]WIB13870.1 ATP-binding cassette domain-containing protein [Curtobacterium sp. MCPF17_052]